LPPDLSLNLYFHSQKKAAEFLFAEEKQNLYLRVVVFGFFFFFIFFVFGKMRIWEILLNSAEEPGFLSPEGEEVLLAKKVTPVLHMNTLTLDALCHVLPPCQVRESACFFMHVKILICSLLASKAGGQW